MDKNDDPQIEKDELRLKIALLRGYLTVATTSGPKLMRPDPAPRSPFSPPRNLEAPNWPSDPAAALRLTNDFRGPSDRLTLQRNGSGWSCEIETGGQAYRAAGETIEMAICRAYLAAKTAQQE